MDGPALPHTLGYDGRTCAEAVVFPASFELIAMVWLPSLAISTEPRLT